MAATFACPHCDNAFRVNDADAGKLVVCPTCLQATRVAVAAAAQVPKAVFAPGATGVARLATLVVQPPAHVVATKPLVLAPIVPPPDQTAAPVPAMMVTSPAIAMPAQADVPPIVFLCPTCEASFSVPHAMVGQKIVCSGCSQRVQVPAPSPVPSKHTVFGKLVAGPAPGQRPPTAAMRPPIAPQPPASQPTAQAVRATPLASIVAAISRFHASRLSLRASAIVLAVVLVGVLVCAFVAMRSPIATERVGGRGSGGYRLVVPRPGQSSGEAFYDQMLLDIGKK